MEIIAWLLPTLMSLLIVFHCLILAGLIPHSIIWGGRVKSRKQLIRLQSISITLSAVFLWIILERTAWVEGILTPHFSSISTWVLFGFFALNTFTNMASKNKFEQRFFAPFSALLAALCLVLQLS